MATDSRGGLADLERDKPRRSHLIAPEDHCRHATPDGPAPVFNVDPGALFENARAFFANDRSFEDTEVDDTARRIRAVAVTKLMKFKDDVTIEVLPHAAGSTIAIYSCSRVGFGDMGTNKKRVDGIVAHLQKDVMLARGEGGITQKDPGYSEVSH